MFINLSRLYIMLLVAFLAGNFVIISADTQSDGMNHGVRMPASVHYQPNRFAGRAGRYYNLIWGVDSLSVKSVEQGELIRFSWRVLEPGKASALADKKAEPSLIDPQAGVRLVVPQMETVGQLRQSSAPEAGRSYWMAFSNKGRHVKRGDRVSVVIGRFHADGLVVD